MSEDFKYLGNNPGTQNVPFLDNVNVQKTVTNFNYSLWGASTKLYLKHVPASWSNDYQNVVQFENKSARDTYFKTNPPITLETEFRIGHDGTIRLPIPYDNLINYNYLVAEYPDAPVPNYQSNIARKQYFYFIKDCRYIAPNTTEVILDLDIWTSYLDDIEIANMQLERGHYPMTLTDVDSYLENPLLNRIGLDTMDVSFGSLCKIPTDHQFNIYGEVFYLVATTSDPTSFIKNTTTYNGESGQNKWHKGLFYFSIAESNWTTWVNNTMNNTPAFFQTIRGILVMPRTLFSEGSTSFEFNGVNCYVGLESVFSLDYTFTKEDFGYDNKYKWLTKLYTSPYAVVELLDFNGNKQQIPFEDLYVGKFAMQLFCNLAMANPSARIVLMNVGGSGNNGEFNQTAIDVTIPSMSVNLSPIKKYLFETEYPRIQQQNDINTSYNNGVRTNNTGKQNADASADVGHSITLAGLNLNKELIDLQTGLDNGYMMQNVSRDLDRQTEIVNLENEILAYNNLIYNNLANSLKDIDQQAQALNYVFAGANQMLGAGSSMGFNAAQNGGNPGLAAAGSVFTGGVTSTLSGFNLLMTMGLADDKQQLINDTNTLQKDNAIGQNNLKLNQSKIYALDKLGILQNDMNTRNSKTYDVGVSNNNASRDLAKANALRSYNTASSNLSASKSNSEAAIQNAINQSYLNDNATYSVTGDHSKWVNGLMALHYHIKTQSDDAIRLAGDYFLRYGYAYNGNCQFTNFNIMKYYTFWKCQEVWLSSDKINSNVIDKFKNILERGVTVWRSPADMGNVSIYDNTIL